MTRPSGSAAGKNAGLERHSLACPSRGILSPASLSSAKPHGYQRALLPPRNARTPEPQQHVGRPAALSYLTERAGEGASHGTTRQPRGVTGVRFALCQAPHLEEGAWSSFVINYPNPS